MCGAKGSMQVRELLRCSLPAPLSPNPERNTQVKTHRSASTARAATESTTGRQSVNICRWRAPAAEHSISENMDVYESIT